MIEKILRIFPYVRHLEEKEEIMNEGLEIAGRVESELKSQIGTLRRIVKNDDIVIQDDSVLLKEKNILLDEIRKELGKEKLENKKLEHKNRQLEVVIIALLQQPHYVDKDERGRYVKIISKEQEHSELYETYIEVEIPKKDLKVYIEEKQDYERMETKEKKKEA